MDSFEGTHDKESGGDAIAGDYTPDDYRLARRLIEENYALLLGIARSKRRRANLSDTMSTVDLLHESYLKLDGQRVWQSTEHFVRSAVLAMRHVIVDHARRKLAVKRGQGVAAVPLEDGDEGVSGFAETPEEIIAIADLLERLRATNPRWMRVVDARYFSGMTEVETAQALGTSERTVRRDWVAARAWIATQMGIEHG
jgi:RNA polymerase sigma factor (TIGR02999 family)